MEPENIPPPIRLKAGIMEQVVMIISRQRHGKCVSAATDTDAAIEDVVISVGPLLGIAALKRFPQQLVNTQQEASCWERCFQLQTA
jgi:hypothetical protein